MSAPDLVGKPAPIIELRRATDGELYKVPIGSKRIALFFFPSLSGPTCAGEVCSFQDAVTDIPSFRDALDLEVVGISSVSLSSLYLYDIRFLDTVDPQERLSAFAKKHGITYPLLSDT
ncbi:hypothetical protein FFLO_05080 [Filobasidium floriforme]|uniref:Alkyl hydroperoxide reductase subunit C/ Thiol specific antioxidant domain-containing protein n=1 Tax=Filobasidium floriforme TaxID=5210 RepID=A0A8K0NRN8_9TREE|nr:uncharacterized protein HD553DRAFT_117636 [Filobasidium floriforme]KAG7530364.1 hypothetical protein FFLO_05080 [Filobasidium floriforme]KAH8080657.1 hypothetical protein HD553DRAFT_117636 [Filobasidium floriforme]